MRSPNEPNRSWAARTRHGVLAIAAWVSLTVAAATAHGAPKTTAPGKPGAPAPASGTTASPSATSPDETPAAPDTAEPAEAEPTGPESEPVGPAPNGEIEAAGDAEPGDEAEAPTAASRVDPAALAAIQAESRALQDELFKARARVATVTSKLFRAKVTLQLRSNLERFYEVSDLVVAIDGAPVFMQPSGLPTAAGDLFEVYAAPGAHELSISARLVARRDATYKLRIDDTFTVYVPEDSTVSTRLMLRETGNMWRFTKRGRGRHAVGAILRARSKPNTRGRGAAKAKLKAGASTSFRGHPGVGG